MKRWCMTAFVWVGLVNFGSAAVLRWDDGTTIPGTAGINLGPQANLAHLNLSFADFSFANLTQANFSGSTLRNANFVQTNVTNADFSEAVISETNFAGSIGLTKEQLYSTASYRRHDLDRLFLSGQDVTGWNFAGKKMRGGSLNSAKIANTNFVGADLDGTDLYAANITTGDFTDANVVNLTFSFGEMTGANFTRADIRGTIAFRPEGVNVTNMIFPNGRIQGLALADGEAMRIRDHQGRPLLVPGQREPAIGITIERHMQLARGASLDVILGSDAWGSMISFNNAHVDLQGALALRFADGVLPVQQVGRTFKLFDWRRANRTGTFTISSPYSWDTSKLYTTGEVTLVAVPEPAGLFLSICGVCGTALARRRLTGIPTANLPAFARSPVALPGGVVACPSRN